MQEEKRTVLKNQGLHSCLRSVKKKKQVIKDKMDRTFAYRRREVLEDMPYVVEFKSRWLALFIKQEVFFVAVLIVF